MHVHEVIADILSQPQRSDSGLCSHAAVAYSTCSSLMPIFRVRSTNHARTAVVTKPSEAAAVVGISNVFTSVYFPTMERNESCRKRRGTAAQTAAQAADRRAANRQRQRDRRAALKARRVSCGVPREAALVDINADGQLQLQYIDRHNCGELNLQCKHCSAKFFADERLSNSSLASPKFGLCCLNGKIKLWSIPDPPEPLATLLTDTSPRCRQFRRDIRRYNCALCLASLKANEVTFSSGPSVFKVHGELHRYIGPMRPADGQQPKCLQTFFVDATMQAEVAGQRFGAVDANLMKDLRCMLELNSSYVRSFVTIDEQLQAELLPQSVSLELLADRQPSSEHRGRYNLPSTNEEVAILIPGETRAARSIVVQPRAVDGQAAGLQIVPETHRSWDPLHYVLLFPYGTDGFHLAIPKDSKSVTAMEYYCWRLMQRDGLNIVLRGGRLFQQYVVDACAKMEQQRLSYLRFNQDSLRSDIYRGVADAVMANDGDRAGRRIVLPSSFTGGARYMHRLFQDAMAIVRRYGKPHLFITFTCNTQWPEIQSSLFNGQTANDRPDIVCRVFRLKLHDMIDVIVNKHIFGTVVAHVETIEFQKRGLPHAHMLFILTGRQHCWQEVDRYVCAELPDPAVHGQLHDIVISCMLHGVCGPSSACYREGSCSKGFPKPFRRQTTMGDDCYPLYRRQSPDDGGQTYTKYVRGQQTKYDNRWVVPYNAYLLLRYNAHINVEYCATIKAVKYLYKYIFKGHDRAIVAITPDNTSLRVDDTVTDEIRNYVDCRYIGAMEAVWRIFHFPLHDRRPAVQTLTVHLEDEQRVIFADGEASAVVERGAPRTTLTEFFVNNAADVDARQHLYHEYPEHYTWNSGTRRWSRRKRNGCCTIGRMYTIHPNQGDMYYLRLLLLHVHGPTSFADVRTVGGQLCETYKEACSRLNLLEDDAEWCDCLADAAQCRMPSQLRLLFVSLLLFCEPANPLSLFEQFAVDMAEDFAHALSTSPQRDVIARNKLLLYIDKLLIAHDRSLIDFNLPATDNSLPEEDACADQRDLDAADYLATNEPLLNDDQRHVFDTVRTAVSSGCGGIYFLDAPGGTGKTFILNCLLASVRQMDDVALAVASSGIAATLLKLGRTAHSRFKLPIPIAENSTCNVTPRSASAEVIRQTKLVVWDEAPMCHRYIFDAVSRTLCDIKQDDRPFGGIVTLLAGDFRQILPVVRLSRRAEIVASALTRSPLWQQITVVKLQRNMRVENCARDDHHATVLRQHADWLLQLGDGKLPLIDNGNVQLSSALCVASIDELTAFVFDNLTTHCGDIATVSSRAILCPRNNTVDAMNDRILDMFPGDVVSCLSVDTVGEVDQQALYPVEYLNSLNLSGLPPHRLNIKVGAPIMLLRNMDPVRGHCNGTRYVVRQIGRRYIEAEITCGEYAGNVLFIPRITLSPTDAGLPFTLRRRQFPVRPAFAMTINKAQGQTLTKCGILLEEPVFTHGQLYVAASRCGDPQNIRFCVNNFETANVVYNEVLS